MSIISKMLGVLGIHERENYFLVEYYSHIGCGFTSLVVKIGECYYDINNHKFVDISRFTMSKPLDEYLERDNLLQDKKSISTIRAKSVATKNGYYKEFFEEWKKNNLKDENILVDKDFTFYAIV